MKTLSVDIVTDSSPCSRLLSVNAEEEGWPGLTGNLCLNKINVTERKETETEDRKK